MGLSWLRALARLKGPVCPWPHLAAAILECSQYCLIEVFPGGASGKEPTWRCRQHRRRRFDPWVRKIPWRQACQPTPVFSPRESHGQEEPGAVQSMGLQRVEHDWSALVCIHAAWLFKRDRNSDGHIVLFFAFNWITRVTIQTKKKWKKSKHNMDQTKHDFTPKVTHPPSSLSCKPWSHVCLLHGCTTRA